MNGRTIDLIEYVRRDGTGGEGVSDGRDITGEISCNRLRTSKGASADGFSIFLTFLFECESLLIVAAI